MVNKHNGYCYGFINYIENPRQRRIHILVAQAFVDNPNKNRNTIVGHMDNNKSNNIYTNLYWTSNRDNTKKAVDDNLCVNKKGIDNSSSNPIKVIDIDNNLIAAYGSQQECARNIVNIDISYLSKMLKLNGNYTPRNKFYKYIKITKEEFNNIDDIYKNKQLIEKQKAKKGFYKFKAYNKQTGETFYSDNQKKFATDHNLKQAMISRALLYDNDAIANWNFKIIEESTYKDCSCYDNLLELSQGIKLKNIHTNKIIEFVTDKECKDYFGLTGNSIDNRDGRIIEGEWEVI